MGYLYKETFLGQSPPVRPSILRLGTSMSGFYKYSFTTRERDEGKHASIIQKGKTEMSSALFVDSARLALGGLEIRNLVLWNERTGQMNALIINIGRRWG